MERMVTMKRKLMPLILCIVLMLGSFVMASGADALTGLTFADMPDNWSTAALKKAVENELLMGYEENGARYIKAGNNLTRAEMAAVINRAFASFKKADVSKVTDVTSSSWYYDDMAKAVKMGTFAFDTKMRPKDKITRQEAFTVLARAFRLVDTDPQHKALNKFSDKGEIASWALDSLNGMAAAGYIQGSGGKLNPRSNITRAEFAVVMDNLVKEYIDSEGTVTEVVASGNVLVRKTGLTLKNVTVKGDLIVADGVGEGDLILDNVKVEGRMVVRGGGENSILIKGNSDIGKIIVAKVDGKVRIIVEGNAKVEVVYVDDGSDDVIVEGTFPELEVAGDGITAFASNANLNKGIVSGNNSRIIVGAGSHIKNGVISGKFSTIEVAAGGKVDKILITGSDATVKGNGQVVEVEVKSGGDNAAVNTPYTKTQVDEGVNGVTAGGTEVPGGSSATNDANGVGTVDGEEGGGGGGGGGGGPITNYKKDFLEELKAKGETYDTVYEVTYSGDNITIVFEFDADAQDALSDAENFLDETISNGGTITIDGTEFKKVQSGSTYKYTVNGVEKDKEIFTKSMAKAIFLSQADAEDLLDGRTPKIEVNYTASVQYNGTINFNGKLTFLINE